MASFGLLLLLIVTYLEFTELSQECLEGGDGWIEVSEENFILVAVYSITIST